jgi:Response regulator containing a CheY-like receiver domain and an HTH DNA-binding domain
MDNGKLPRVYKIIRAEGFLYFIAWALVYLLFMDREYEFWSFSGKIVAVVPDSLFYISIIAVNLYFIFSASRITAGAKKSTLLFINIIALLINCWGYMNDFALVFYPLGAEIIDMYPFNPVIAVYLLVNIITMGYLYKNNVFAWQNSNQSQAAKANADISAYTYEEIQKRFHLTKREFEIIHLVYQGRSNPEISEYLNISTGTVKRHIQNIFKKMDIKNRYELIYLIKSE